MDISTDAKSRAKLVLSTDGEHEVIIDMAQIPIEHAAKAVQLNESILRHLVNAGAVAGTGDLCDLESATTVAGKLEAARAPVEGQGILTTDAAAKYRFTNQGIYKWIESGWVRVLVDRERNRLINEGDIAFARQLADLLGQTRGRSIFPAKPRSGRPRKLAS